MKTVFDRLKWRNCTQLRLVLLFLYPIAVFLLRRKTLKGVYTGWGILSEKTRILRISYRACMIRILRNLYIYHHWFVKKSESWLVFFHFFSEFLLTIPSYAAQGIGSKSRIRCFSLDTCKAIREIRCSMSS